MIKIKPTFKYTTKIILMLSLFLVVIIVFLNSWNTSSDKKVKEFVLYENKGKSDYLNIQDFNRVDTLPSMEKIGFVKGDFLVGFSLENLFDDPEKPSVLEFSNPYFYKLSLYKVGKDGVLDLIKEAGTSVGSSTPLTYPRPLFEFTYEDVKDARFFAVIQSQDPIGFELVLEEKSEYLEKYSSVMLLVHIYMGVMLALFLYNIILFFMISDRVYLFYSFYVLFITLAQLSLLGFSYFYILGQDPILFSLSIVGFTSVAGIFAVLFFKRFLKTSYFIPKLDRFLVIIIILYAFGFLMRLIGIVNVSYLIIDVTGLIGVVLFITTAAIISGKGYRPAVYFLIAWGVFLLGLVIFIIQNQGFLPSGRLANLPMLIGTAMEAILLSLALADRINILKKEKEKEQREKVNALKENERLIKEQNVYLEKMVRSRTEELEKTLKNLQTTQTQLVNQEKMASLGQLTAGIAHEINNPINFVSSNISPLKRDLNDLLELLEFYRQKGKEEFSAASQKAVNELEEELELEYLLDEVNQLLCGIADGANRTVEIVKGLRLFSRVDEQDIKKVDIHDGLDSTLILLNSSMQGLIQVNKTYGELPLVECLAGKINQVFMNIINNAIHALLDPHHKRVNPCICIRTFHQEDHVRIEIQDNGPGMPDHVKEKIFEPFFTTKEVGKGTGLGLSIVYTVIENHKGKLQVNTKLNEGTIFVIILPVNQKAEI